MKRLLSITAAFAFALSSVPAHAGWKLIAHGTPVAVAKSKLTVTAGEDWNRSGYRPIKKSEVWTLDGLALNELYFVSGLAAGETLYRDTQKKDRPLPKFADTMQLTDIPEFVESSYRMLLNTSVFEVTNVTPAQIGGHAGIKFSYRYAVEGSALIRRGVSVATIVDKQLHIISFTAPATYYFDRDAPKVEAIMSSATL